MGKALIHNWQWKLLSLFLAVCLWSGLITQDESLTREKIFNDVSINVTNADTLRRNGFIIVSGLDDLPAVRIRVDVPQKNYNTVTASNYNLRIDLSRIRETGEQTLQVLSSSSSNYGTVTDISVESVAVQVDEYITRSRSREDERVLIAEITEKGERLRDKAVEVPAQMACCIRLEPEEAAELYKLLYKLLGNFKD